MPSALPDLRRGALPPLGGARFARLQWLALAGLVALLTWALPAEEAGYAASPPVAGGESALLAVADLRGQALVVFDPGRPDAARRIPLPGGPHELARLPDGRIVASLEQAGALAVVDVATGAVETVRVGGLPHGLSLAGSVLYVTDREQGGVRRFSPAGWREEPALEAGTWPHAVTALPGGGLAVADAARSLLRIGGVEVRVSALPETVAVSPDGTRIATAGALGDAVEVYDASGQQLLRVAVGGRPVRVAFSPGGGQIAAALSAEGAVALVDARGAVRKVAVGGLPDGLLYSGGLLYAGDLSAGRVTAIDPAAGRVAAVFAVEAAGEVRSTGALLALPSARLAGGLVCPFVRQ